MLSIIVNKEPTKATVTFDGKEQTLNLVKVVKDGVKPGTYWVNMQPLGTPKKWATVNFNDHAEAVFTVEVDETAHRTVSKKYSRMITMVNIREYLTEEQVSTFEGLVAVAQAECDKRIAEAEANKPVKEKKPRGISMEAKLAKKLAEIEKLKKQIAGELPLDPPKSKKAAVIEDLDSDTVDAF